ncbi:class I SAM-dependent methyltransferase [Micromonospora globispora]|uniref:Class I SAM-dependent methyltransferase n=1 Tax=Micromonospora globispora TaxID=1450148 RepID=A0A317JX66_9ACTN|nr:class I SAM-dependent methyltransferase [Micromonospora globispora]PWU59350.1 class I SAM-dependent methyltransferase [Micromonospora globispora]RQW81842.1 class I SAM-dependent methyltransferase [Micromonospora globispora]
MRARCPGTITRFGREAALAFDPSEYGRHIPADVYDQAYAHLDPEAAVDRLIALADGGPICEFGIGTGRLALPLVQRGMSVAGVEGSEEMAARLRSKPDGGRIELTIGNFAEARVHGQFALVLLAFNTIFALPDQPAQVACFRNAAAHLRPGGRFVIEAWVPDPAAFHAGGALRPVWVAEDAVLLEAALLHPAAQRMTTTKIRLTHDGVQLLPANHRYAWPAELDLMAELAGMTLESRWADWTGRPFTDESREHVSVYQLGEAQ